MNLAKHAAAWWITGHEDGVIGPYNTRAEAEQDRAGLERTARHGHHWAYWTTDPCPAGWSEDEPAELLNLTLEQR